MTRISATVDRVGGASDMLGRPGVIHRYQELQGQEVADVTEACCPGCGQAVVRLIPPADESLTCPEELWFRVCCGWRGQLTNGVWIGEPAATQTG